MPAGEEGGWGGGGGGYGGRGAGPYLPMGTLFMDTSLCTSVKMGGGSGLHVLAGQEFHLATPGVGLDTCTQQHDDQGVFIGNTFHLATPGIGLDTCTQQHDDQGVFT